MYESLLGGRGSFFDGAGIHRKLLLEIGKLGEVVEQRQRPVVTASLSASY